MELPNVPTRILRIRKSMFYWLRNITQRQNIYIYELAHSPIKHAKTYDDMRILDDLVKEGVLTRHEEE